MLSVKKKKKEVDKTTFNSKLQCPEFWKTSFKHNDDSDSYHLFNAYILHELSYLILIIP